MKIERLRLWHVSMELVHPFETSFGREERRDCIVLAVESEGMVGWGECTANNGPFYSYETIETAWHVLTQFLVPMVRGVEIDSPTVLPDLLEAVKGHPMAKAGLEMPLWDWFGRAENKSLKEMLGGGRDAVDVGVSLGIEPTLGALVEKVDRYVGQGYKRVKLKIKPGWDVEPLRAVREKYPDLLLQVDANSAYVWEQKEQLLELDQFNMLLLEQPFHHEDLVDHAKLQKLMKTPICLDESIHAVEHMKWAIELGACQVVNIKQGRVGGLANAVKIHDMCQENNIKVWCGGMLETNLGRAANLALATLPNFVFPGDISASARYYHQDIAAPSFALNENAQIEVPDSVGLGVSILPDELEKVTVKKTEIVF